MNKLNLLIGLIFVLLMSVSFACNIDIDNEIIELRSEEDGYGTSIYAEDNSEIDIKIDFEITNASGSDCPSNISTKAKVYRWDDTDNEWDYWKTTSTKSQTLEEDTFSFTWSNDFDADDQYKEYKVEGIILEGSTELETMESYIDVTNNTCSGIILTTSDFTIDEGNSKTRVFSIENNTNKDFDITNADILFSNSVIDNGSVDYPTIVSDNDTENVDVILEASYVSSDTTATGRFRVSGYLDGDYCSYSEIGEEEFEVTVEDTGSNNNNNTSSSECDDLTIHTKTITVGEGKETKEIFYIKNESTKRFELLDIDTTENGLELRSYYYEKYAFPGDIADIVIQAIAPNVTSNKTYENVLEIKGRFSDGKTCDFDDITEGDYDVYITDISSEVVPDCGSIVIDVPNEVRIANAATIPFTITNNSNMRVDIIIKSTLTIDPTLISLPGRTSMSRELFVSIDGSEGQIYLNAQSACPVENKTIHVINTVSGSLSQVSIGSEIVNNNNTTILRISFDNPTDKAFKGVLSIDLDGLAIDDKVVTIAPGQSTIDIPLDSNNNLTGTVTFTSNDQEISTTISSNDQDSGLLSGFFGLGFGVAGIAIILVLVIIAVVLIVTLYEGTRYDEIEQPFVKYKQ